jgi:hypothetical protein
MPKGNQKQLIIGDTMNTNFDSLQLSISGIAEYGLLRLDERQLIPRGTFGGAVYDLGLLRDGQVVSANTGDQGGGQN